jgi:hypothetical protein
LAVNRSGDGLGQQSFPHAGQVFQEDMPLGKQAQQGQADVVVRSDDDASYIVYQPLQLLLEVFRRRGLDLS